MYCVPVILKIKTRKQGPELSGARSHGPVKWIEVTQTATLHGL